MTEAAEECKVDETNLVDARGTMREHALEIRPAIAFGVGLAVGLLSSIPSASGASPGELQLLIGWERLRDGDPEGARDSFARDGSSPQASALGLAIASAALGDTDRARSALRRVFAGQRDPRMQLPADIPLAAAVNALAGRNTEPRPGAPAARELPALIASFYFVQGRTAAAERWLQRAEVAGAESLGLRRWLASDTQAPLEVTDISKPAVEDARSQETGPRDDDGPEWLDLEREEWRELEPGDDWGDDPWP